MDLRLVLLLALAKPLVAAADGDRIVLSKRGLTHLNEYGRPAERRLFGVDGCGHKYWGCRVAVNPRNGTVCWASPEIEAVRCAQLGSMKDSWDFPWPKILRHGQFNALAYDAVGDNWFLDYERGSYVCSYQFDRCLKLGQSRRCGEKYHVAYDTMHGLAFHIDAECTGPFWLESQRYGAGRRMLQTNLTAPSALAVDTSTQRVFWMDSINDSTDGVFSVDYDGQQWQQVLTVPRRSGSEASAWALDAAGGIVTVMRSESGTVKAISTSAGGGAAPAGSDVKEEEIPSLAEMGELLSVTIFPPEPQRQASDDRCNVAGCKDICVPTVVNNEAAVTCLCLEGSVMVDITCQKEYPFSHAVVVGRDVLNLVDLQTEEVLPILSVENIRDVDFLWTDDETFLLFWTNGRSLYSGHWLPGETTVGDVRQLVTAIDGSSILEVAVDWSQHNSSILWLEKSDSETGSDSFFAVKMAPLDVAYSRTILSGAWHEQRSLSVLPLVTSNFGLLKQDTSAIRFISYTLAGEIGESSTLNRFGNINSGMTTPAAFTIGFTGGLQDRTRFVWANQGQRSLEQLALNISTGREERATLLTHPSLADAGGLDVLEDRAFWTERSSGLLWTSTGGVARSLPTPAGSGTLKLLHPWRQPMPEVPVACDRPDIGCSHFCMNLYRDALCLCPDDLALGDDQKTCHQSTPVGHQ